MVYLMNDVRDKNTLVSHGTQVLRAARLTCNLINIAINFNFI